MAEIILPPEENEETPQVPELNIDKPTDNSKVITIEFEAKKTNKVSTKDTHQQLYTTDTDAWFEFKETSLEGANGTYSVVFRNRHDGSIFQRTGDVVNGVAYYKIPHQEIRHAGAWRGQVVYTLSNGDTTAQEFDYDVKGHILDGKDVRKIVVEDFETLMSQLRSMKDNAELELAGLVNTANQNETDRQVFFDDLVEDIDELQANYQELLDTGVFQTNINEKLEQLEEEYAPKLTEVTAQLAQTKHYQTMGNEQIRPVVTFLDDDSKRAVYTRLKNIFESRGVTTGISAVPIQIQVNNPDYITQNQLLELYNNGHEILGHGYRERKTVDADLTYAELDYEIGGGNKGYFDSLGIKTNGHVYPGGQSDEQSRAVTRKYFDFAYGGVGIEDGSEVLDTMKIKRIAFSNSTNNNPEINGNNEKNTLAYYKACVDYAIETNGWLTFMTHIQTQPTSDDQVLGDLIDYIKYKGVDILNPSDAYKIHGNRYFSGDVDNGTFTVISKKGILENAGGLTINKLKANEKLLSDTIRTYPKNSITYMFQSAHASLPENTPGYIVTYRLRDNPSLDQEIFNFREFWPNGSNKKYISRVLTDNQGNQWGAWEQKYDGVKTKKVITQDPKVPAGGSALISVTVDGVVPLETYITANAAYGLPKDMLYNVFVANVNEVGIRFFNLGETDYTARRERTWFFTYR